MPAGSRQAGHIFVPPSHLSGGDTPVHSLLKKVPVLPGACRSLAFSGRNQRRGVFNGSLRVVHLQSSSHVQKCSESASPAWQNGPCHRGMCAACAAELLAGRVAGRAMEPSHAQVCTFHLRMNPCGGAEENGGISYVQVSHAVPALLMPESKLPDHSSDEE